MKKSIRNLFLCAAAAALLSGCGKLDRVEQTTVYVDPDNGAVQEAVIGEYTEEDTYSEKELKEFVEEDAASYNQEAGTDAVTVSGVEVSKDRVRILLRYPDAESYAGYHRTEFFWGSLAQAQENGYDFSGTFLDSEGNETVIGEILSSEPEYHVIVFEEAMQILTDRPILYVSSNATVTSDTTAEVSKDTVNQEAGVVTSEKAYVIYE